MRRTCLHLAVSTAITLVTWMSSRGVYADPPHIIGTYRFGPRVSTLVSIGNIDHELNIYGTFDFIRGWEYRDDPPSIFPYADFDNVQAWAHHPLSLAPPLNLDAIFNLSGLRGEQLPTASIFDVYKFAGKNLTGDQVEVFVSVLGRWLYLRGETSFRDQPELGWRMSGLAHQRPFADFDEDGDVDADDLAVWRNHFGTWIGLNDADGDDFQTGADFLHWQRQFGETAPDPASLDAAIDAALSASASAVPEPGTFALGAVGLGWVLVGARRVRSLSRVAIG